MDKYEKYLGELLDGRYRLENIIGNGGSAVVYEAEDTLMHRKVALKMLKDTSPSVFNIRSFDIEAKAVAMLSHPNIVNVYDVSVKSDEKYIIMEYVDGITLREYLDHNGALPADEVISCARQVLRALSEAHAKGIVHRDIKPQNIMILKDGQIKVTDFGIAKLPETETVIAGNKGIGTVQYISPEQAGGDETDCRSDIYSVGVLLYEMATGRLPFSEGSASDIALRHMTDTPTLPRDINPDIPFGLEQVINRAMEKDPENRYRNAEAMLRALDKLADDPTFVFKAAKIAGAQEKKNKGASFVEKLKQFFSGKTGIIIAVIAAALAILLSVLLIVLIPGSSEKEPEPTVVRIPNYVGSIYSNASHEEKLAEGLNIQITYVINEEYPEGQVIAQEPLAGELVRLEEGEYAELMLYISWGDEKLALGKIEGNYKYVIEQLNEKYSDLAFAVLCEFEYNDTVAEGDVIRYSYETSVDVIKGGLITLYVSVGNERTTSVVPSVEGKLVAEAAAEIEAAGLIVGEIKYVASAIKENKVISQSIEAGKSVPGKITKVDIVVSGGLYHGLIPHN